jgi:hypothetical protein
MKFLPLSEFEEVASALNFDTTDCHVVGRCDLYTTKAVGGDRKLYKNIEQSLESQYEAQLRLSASLSPPHAASAAILLNLSRSSPFGPLSEHSSRRTFAYLIATLNASYPDYDFSHVLRPSDFRRERNLKKVMNAVDTMLFNLRPRLRSDAAPASPDSPSDSYSPGLTPSWGPQMWRIIDQQMTLKECAVYSYSPEENLCEIDDGVIWSLNYFFFNKTRKRVCYLYLRGIPIFNHTAPDRPLTPCSSGTFDDGYLTPNPNARKRARHWFGYDSTANDTDTDEETRPSKVARPLVDEHDNYVLSDEEVRSPEGNKGEIRTMSEEMVESMEV